MKVPTLFPRLQILYATKQQEVAEVLAQLLREGAGVSEKQIEMMACESDPPHKWYPSIVSYRYLRQGVIALLSEDFLGSPYCLALLGLSVVQCPRVIPFVLPFVEEYEEVCGEPGLQTPATISMETSDDVDRLAERLLDFQLIKTIRSRAWDKFAGRLIDVGHQNASQHAAKELSVLQSLALMRNKLDAAKRKKG